METNKSATDLAKDLAGKRLVAKQLWDSKPDKNFTDAEIDDMNQKNQELSDLHDAWQKRTKLEASMKANDEALSKLEEPRRNLPFAGGNAKEDGNLTALGNSLTGYTNPDVKSLGELFIESAAYKSYDPTRHAGPSVDIGMKTVFATSGGSPGYTIQNIRTGTVVDYKLRQPVMDSIIPMGRTNMQAIVYMEESAPTNGSIFVTENDSTTGEATLAYTEKSVNVRKVRVSLPVTDEMMADAPMMMDIINTRLLELLALKKDQAIINGSGTAPEILGLLNVSGIQTQARGSDPGPDAFYKALTLIATQSFLDPDHILIHPLDWQNIRLLRTPDGIYVFGSPLDPSPARMWGYPVTATQGLTQGTALVGAFGTATQQFIRQDVTMLASSEHATNFIQGLLTVKAELRMALVAYRPKGLCTVTGL